MFVIRQCETDEDYASAAQLAKELAEWDISEAQKLGISADEVDSFYYSSGGEVADLEAAASAITLVAIAGSTQAACIGYRRMDPLSCELKRLFVRPAFRGCGLGALMISAIVERAAAAGYRYMHLETTRFMEGAMHLYEQAGFIHCDAYYTIPEIFRDVSVFMRKDLRAA